MINTQNLRLGHYVMCHNNLYRINGILESSAYLDSVDNPDEPIFNAPNTDIEPVPLDNNWLGRLPGIVLVRNSDGDRYGGWLLPVNNGHRIRIKNNSWDATYGKVDLTYVHQLQDLYKILTNRELY